jgi:hypothetical protein
MIRTLSFLKYLDMMGAMQIGDPCVKKGKTIVFYTGVKNNYGINIVVDNEFYDLITIKGICAELGVGYNENLLLNM